VYQQTGENGPSPLFCTSLTTSRVLHPIWVSSAQKRCGHSGAKQDQQKVCGMVVGLEHGISENRLRPGVIQPGEEKVRGS